MRRGFVSRLYILRMGKISRTAFRFPRCKPPRCPYIGRVPDGSIPPARNVQTFLNQCTTSVARTGANEDQAKLTGASGALRQQSG